MTLAILLVYLALVLGIGRLAIDSFELRKTGHCSYLVTFCCRMHFGFPLLAT